MQIIDECDVADLVFKHKDRLELAGLRLIRRISTDPNLTEYEQCVGTALVKQFVGSNLRDTKGNFICPVAEATSARMRLVLRGHFLNKSMGLVGAVMKSVYCPMLVFKDFDTLVPGKAPAKATKKAAQAILKNSSSMKAEKVIAATALTQKPLRAKTRREAT